jgi:hypothetical protein
MVLSDAGERAAFRYGVRLGSLEERERIIALLTKNRVLSPAENFDSEVIALIKGENE